MASATDFRISFIVDYFDPQASLTRQYQLLFFRGDNSVEMYDLKNKRVFLKRCPYPTLSEKELFVGATVTIHSRLLKIVDYGDIATKTIFSSKNENVALIVHGRATYNVGAVVDSITSSDARILNFRLVDFPRATAQDLGLKTTRCFAIHMTGGNATTKAEALVAKFGDIAVFVDSNDVQLINDIAFRNAQPTATLENCAVCVIKPHAIASNQGGAILQRLLDEGFDITALAQVTMSVADAEDFLEVYKGVVPEYRKLVEHMSGAPCWAIELRAENAIAALRAVCGPHDPEVCRVLFPTTIRAQFGTDRVKNAVHCTDLPEDGPLESEFFFSLMHAKQQ